MKYNGDKDGKPIGRYCTRACVELYSDGSCGVVRRPAPLGSLCEPWVFDLVEAADALAKEAREDKSIGGAVEEVEVLRAIVDLVEGAE